MGFDLNVSMDSSVIRTLTSLNSLQAIDWSASYALEHPDNLECTDEEMSALPPPACLDNECLNCTLSICRSSATSKADTFMCNHVSS